MFVMRRRLLHLQRKERVRLLRDDVENIAEQHVNISLTLGLRKHTVWDFLVITH